MTVGDRIRAKRQDLGLSVDELAARLGKNRATVYRYEKGDIENMPISVLEPLAQVLQTTPSYLIGWTDDAYDWERDLYNRKDNFASARGEAVLETYGGDYSKAWKALQEIEEDQAREAAKMQKNKKPTTPPGFMPLPKMKKVPLIGAIACGEPITAIQNREGDVNAPEDMRCDFALKCRGDSMIGAGIHIGDVVYIRIQPDVENGEIAAVRIGEEATLKRVYLHSDYIELRPENSAFESIIRRREDMNDVQIEGKAVGWMHWVG